MSRAHAPAETIVYRLYSVRRYSASGRNTRRFRGQFERNWMARRHADRTAGHYEIERVRLTGTGWERAEAILSTRKYYVEPRGVLSAEEARAMSERLADREPPRAFTAEEMDRHFPNPDESWEVAL